MKKVIFLFILSFAICLAACSNKVSTSDEMLDVMKEKENISGDMIECGSIIDDSTMVVVGMTGESDKTYHYYAAQFLQDKDGKYQFETDISLNDIGWQMRVGKWKEGYVIVCNNENVSTIQIVISPRGEDEQVKKIEIEKVPFIYYLDMASIQSDYDIGYSFLNDKGEEVQ